MKKIVGLILGLVLVAVSCSAFIFLNQEKPNFTPETWAKTPWQERHQLVASLEEQHQLKGMTELEVKALLGEPDTMIRGAFEYKIKPDWFFDWRVFYLTFENNRVAEHGTSVPDW